MINKSLNHQNKLDELLINPCVALFTGPSTDIKYNQTKAAALLFTFDYFFFNKIKNVSKDEGKGLERGRVHLCSEG